MSREEIKPKKIKMDGDGDGSSSSDVSSMAAVEGPRADADPALVQQGFLLPVGKPL